LVVGAFFVAILEHYLAETRGLVPVIEGGVFGVFVLLFRQGPDRRPEQPAQAAAVALSCSPSIGSCVGLERPAK